MMKDERGCLREGADVRDELVRGGYDRKHAGLLCAIAMQEVTRPL